MISLIWAMTDDRVIGINNRLPWKLPADMRWFRQHTLGKPIIMGRLTFESLGSKPLPDRKNIIVTRDAGYQAQGAEVVTSIDQAIQMTGKVAEAMVIGGASLYQQTLQMAGRLYMTVVHAEIAGDAWFPEFNREEWREVGRNDFLADEKNSLAYSFVIMDRVKPAYLKKADG